MKRIRKQSETSVGAGAVPTPTVLPANERWGIIGNTVIIERLQRQIANGLTSQAVLIVGPRGLGKTTIARAFGNALVCRKQNHGVACGNCASCAAFASFQHPDVQILETARRSIGIDDVRTMQRALERRPALAPRTVAIIDGAESLTEEASNAFLKTLEEPAGTTICILCAVNESRLPPTVVSRCSVYRLTPVPERELCAALERLGVPRQHAREIAAFADGRPAYAQFLAAQPTLFEEAVETSEQLLVLLRSSTPQRLQIAEQIAEQYKDPIQSELLLERWESLSRRMLEAAAGLPEHGPRAGHVAAAVKGLSLREIAGIARGVGRVREHLNATSGLRIALESFALHLAQPT